MDISVVIPVYGCRAAIPELHRRLCENLDKIVKSYEIILVDDCCLNCTPCQGHFELV